MTKDQHLEEQERQYQESVEKSIAHDAAALVQQGFTRLQALAKAREINDNQHAAEMDPTGAMGTLAEAQSPTPPAGKERQTAAIAAQLVKKLGQ